MALPTLLRKCSILHSFTPTLSPLYPENWPSSRRVTWHFQSLHRHKSLYPNECDIKLIALQHPNIQKKKLNYLANNWASYHSAKLSRYFFVNVHYIKCENVVQMFLSLEIYTIYSTHFYIFVLHIIFSNLIRNFKAVSLFSCVLWLFLSRKCY